MNEITGYIFGIDGLTDDGLLWLMVFICVFLLILLTCLILRKFRLWYWKVDLQIDTLKNIDDKLKLLEEGIKESTIFIDESNLQNSVVEAAEEIVLKDETGTQGIKQAETVYSKSSTGRIYTEEELEELIKD